MAHAHSQTPSEKDPRYHNWAREYLEADYRCDYCQRLLPEQDLHRHNCYDGATGEKIPMTIYCSEQCYKLNRAAGNIGFDTDLGLTSGVRL